jgi:hypothetical protein
MQQIWQRGVAGVVGFTLASIAFILKVDSSVLRPPRGQRIYLLSSPQRTQRKQRSRLFTLHRVVAQDVREFR